MELLQEVRRLSHRLRVGAGLSLVNGLTSTAALYGGTDKLQHGYLPYYRRHLGPRRLQDQVVFEIGVGNYEDLKPGGSLRMWRDYLLRAKIVGIDIEEKHVDLGARVHFERADQSSPDDLLRIVRAHGRPDVVIDDGSHVASHIRTSFEVLWPALARGGLYVIEDLSTSYYPQHGGAPSAPASSAVGLLQSLVDAVQAQDATFARKPRWGSRDAPAYGDVASVHVYPGIGFIEKS